MEGGRGKELRDCRLCSNYSIDKDITAITLHCSKGFFHYLEDTGVTEGVGPNFQCDGRDYDFNPGSEWVKHLLK